MSPKNPWERYWKTFQTPQGVNLKSTPGGKIIPLRHPSKMNPCTEFRDFNNAVIYGSDRTIKIIIYDDDKAAGKTTGYSVAIKPADASTPLSMPYGDATAPQSEVLAPEDSRMGEDAVQPTEENSEAGSESNQAEIENTEARQETAEAQTEDKTASLEENQNENAPAPNSDQAEAAELSADGSESSGQTESSEESNQN